ncbi:MAG: replication initiator protein [Microviridae sp.]|nr:MAG: replication initiator protein [Microviridae sp.]
MPCYHPLNAYYSSKLNKKSGKRSLVFNTDQALVPVKIPISCGRCIGCRLDRSLQWALRCVHEASLHDENCFITLTFDEAHVNKEGSLKVSDFQNFMKRLRQKISPTNVRFFHCGEYGANFSRPHHHACLFGYDFPDKVLHSGKGQTAVYTSEILSSLWPFGFHTIGSVTFESAAYVARYVLKKWSKDEMDPHELYNEMRSLTDKEFRDRYYGGRKPEYITMSRRPGIGADWYSKFGSDVYPAGFCLVDGKKVKPPKFYDSKFELDNPLSFAKLKGDRVFAAQVNPHNSRGRLDVREEHKKLITGVLQRGFENGS